MSGSQLDSKTSGKHRLFGGYEPNTWVPGNVRTKLSEKVAFLTVLSVWGLLILSVQPWSRADSMGGGDSSSTLKGVALAVCVATLIIVLPPRSVFKVPLPTAIYLVYASYLILTAGLLPDSISVVVRSARVFAGLLLPVLLWPLLSKRPERLLFANFFAYLALGLSVVAGLLSGPGSSWLDGVPYAAGGRLMGNFLPMMPPRVGEIGAICIGLAVVLWAGRKIPIWGLALAVPLGASLIVLSRTRTAPLALLLGLVVAVILTLNSPVGRRGLAFILTLLIAVAPFFPVIFKWALRNQDPEMIGKLSGRTLVWEHIISAQVTPVTLWLGHGLGEKKVLLRRGEGDINVMAIDNSWLDAYWETGLVGLMLIAMVILVALLYAARTPGPLARFAAVFLLVYVLVASINESGLCDLSSMTLLVLVAVSVSAADRAAFAVTKGKRLQVNPTGGTRVNHVPKLHPTTNMAPLPTRTIKRRNDFP